MSGFRHQTDRRGEFKASLDGYVRRSKGELNSVSFVRSHSDQERHRRQDVQTSLRKQERQERFQRRRNEDGDLGTETPPWLKSELKALPDIIKGLQTYTSIADAEPLLVRLKRLTTAEDNKVWRKLVQAGSYPILVKCLREEKSREMQYNALWALSNLSAFHDEEKGDDDPGLVPTMLKDDLHLACLQLIRAQIAYNAIDQDAAIAERKAVSEPSAEASELARLRRNMAAEARSMAPGYNVQMQATWLLGNLAGDSKLGRDTVAKADAIPTLVAMCVDASPAALLEQCVVCMKNMLRFEHDQLPVEVYSPALPVLFRMVKSKIYDIRSQAVMSLRFVTRKAPPSVIAQFVKANMVDELIKLVTSKTSRFVLVDASDILGDIIFSTDENAALVVSKGGIEAFKHLLHVDNPTLQKTACWSLSNLAASHTSTKPLIGDMIKANVVPLLIKALKHARDSVRNEAAIALSNCIEKGSAEHRKIICNEGGIAALAPVLQTGSSIAVECVLKVFRMLLDAAAKNSKNAVMEQLEEADCLGMIRALALSELKPVRTAAEGIVSVYLDKTDTADEFKTDSGKMLSFGSASGGGAGAAGMDLSSGEFSF